MSRLHSMAKREAADEAIYQAGQALKRSKQGFEQTASQSGASRGQDRVPWGLSVWGMPLSLPLAPMLGVSRSSGAVQVASNRRASAIMNERLVSMHHVVVSAYLRAMQEGKVKQNPSLEARAHEFLQQASRAKKGALPNGYSVALDAAKAAGPSLSFTKDEMRII